MGALVVVVLAVDLWLWPAPSQHRPSTEEISQALAGAAASQEAYREQHGSYTDDRGTLAEAGWVPAVDVDVTLVSADADTFCLAAGPVAQEPVAWLTQDWTPLTEACG